MIAIGESTNLQTKTSRKTLKKMQKKEQKCRMGNLNLRILGGKTKFDGGKHWHLMAMRP